MDETIFVDNEPSSDEDTLDFVFVERSIGKMVDKGLSDSDHISEELKTDGLRISPLS